MANIIPRRNKDGKITSYTIRVYHGYDDTGHRLKPYTTSYKPAPCMTAKQMEKEVQRQAMLFEEQCRLGYTPDSRQTFAQYAEYVLTHKEESGVKHRTITRYRELLTRINAGIGHIRITDLRPQHLTELYSQLRQSGIRKASAKAIPTADLKALIRSSGITKKQFSERSGVSETTLSTVFNGKAISADKAAAICQTLDIALHKAFSVEQDNTPLSEKTVQEHHRLISLVLSYAEKEMLVPYNAAAKVINKPQAERSREVNYFEPEALDRIRDCLSAQPLKWQTITHLLLVTGCRRGEIMGLKWNAIDFENQTIRIHNNLLYSKSLGIYQDSTKTDTSDRTIRIAPETVQLLKEYRAYWEQLKRDAGSQWNSFVVIPDGKGKRNPERAEFLFVKESGTEIGYPMHPDSVTDWLRKFSDRNGLPHINPHAFRHTLASVLCLNGIDMTTISKWLGHKNVTTTVNLSYGHTHQSSYKTANP